MPSGYPKDFWDYVEVSGECLLWVGASLNGYGRSSLCWGDQYAHRSAWIQEVGDIPEGKLVLHTCDVKKCVNPKHLYLGDYVDNARDAAERGLLNPARGTQLPQTKLRDEDVDRIRILVSGGNLQKDVASKFEVTPSCISKIMTGDRRTSVGG